MSERAVGVIASEWVYMYTLADNCDQQIRSYKPTTPGALQMNRGKLLHKRDLSPFLTALQAR